MMSPPDSHPPGAAPPILAPQCFEAIRDSVLLVDLASGLVIDANAASEVLFGMTRDALVGSTHGALFRPGTSPALGDGAAGLPSAIAVDVVTVRGELVPVAASVVPLALADGREALQLVLRSAEARSRSERVLAEHRRVARELSAAGTAAEIAAATVAAALRIPGIDIAGVYLFAAGTDVLDLVASGGADASFVDAHARYAPDAPNVRWLRSTLMRRPVALEKCGSTFWTTQSRSLAHGRDGVARTTMVFLTASRARMKQRGWRPSSRALLRR